MQFRLNIAQVKMPEGPATFLKWFHESFVKQMTRFQINYNTNGKALLLIDDVPSRTTMPQLTSDDSNIVTVFVQLRCTPLI